MRVVERKVGHITSFLVKIHFYLSFSLLPIPNLYIPSSSILKAASLIMRHAWRCLRGVNCSTLQGPCLRIVSCWLPASCSSYALFDGLHQTSHSHKSGQLPYISISVLYDRRMFIYILQCLFHWLTSSEQLLRSLTPLVLCFNGLASWCASIMHQRRMYVCK